MKKNNLVKFLFEDGEEKNNDKKPQDKDLGKNQEEKKPKPEGDNNKNQEEKQSSNSEKNNDENQNEDDKEVETSNEEENVKPEEISSEDVEEESLEKSIDDELLSVLTDFEQKARTSAQQNKKTLNFENKRFSIKKILLKEEANKEIDINLFASDIARLIKNYTNLIDIEGIIFNKSVKFIEKNYDFATANKLKEILKDQYGIDIKKPNTPTDDVLQQPIAVGAIEGGGISGGSAS